MSDKEDWVRIPLNEPPKTHCDPPTADCLFDLQAGWKKDRDLGMVIRCSKHKLLAPGGVYEHDGDDRWIGGEDLRSVEGPIHRKVEPLVVIKTVSKDKYDILLKQRDEALVVLKNILGWEDNGESPPSVLLDEARLLLMTYGEGL